jgi:hypothetical protein
MVGVISSGFPLHFKANPIATKILPPPSLPSMAGGTMTIARFIEGKR